MANNIFSLEVLPAKEGDCLILRYGPNSPVKQKVAVIDGGPGGVFKNHLKKRLEQLRTELEVPQEDPMPLSWMMVSHVDRDHITGVVQLTEELMKPGPNRFVQPARLWHNTFNDILGADPGELKKIVTKALGTASLSGEVMIDELAESAQVDAGAVMILAGVEEGIDLREKIETIEPKIKINDGKKGLVVAKKGGKAFAVGDGLSFTVIGPMMPEVEALRKKHDEFLAKPKDESEDALQALAAVISKDGSVTNLSSLVILAEFGEETILFTGDARADKILDGIGLVLDRDTLHVDVLKGQHHGSDNNFTQEFFERVTADHYVFSGDGKHGNPERETFEFLRRARPGEDYKIYLTYEIDDIDVLRKKDWETKQAIKVSKGNPPGPNWSAPKQSLAAFFKKHPDMKKRVVKLGGDLPRHRIDLLAKLDE